MTFNFQEYADKSRYANDNGIENSFYTMFENLLDNIFQDTMHYHILNNPASTKGEGHPDFQGDLDGVPFLRVEAKPPKYNMKNWLDDPNCHEEAARLSHQLHRYRGNVNMVMLTTDFKTVWWIDAQEMNEDENKPIPILFTFHFLNDDFSLHKQLEDDFQRLKGLLYLDLETARTNIKDLLHLIMPYIIRLREEFIRILQAPIDANENDLQKHMKELLDDLKKTLFKDYKEDWQKKFTDLYTQLIAYGMFMSWIRFNKAHRRLATFSVDTVSSYLPSGSLIQNLFAGIKDHITSDLRNSVFIPIEKSLNKTEYVDIIARIDDLMNEFYSGFLEVYDPDVKKEMGVIYTPKEVVNFMVRGVDHFLTTTFGMSDGILNLNVKYLDPSAGTMAYPCNLMEIAYQKISQQVNGDTESFHTDAEKRDKFSVWFREAYLRKDDRLSNVFGFEILMAPYLLGSLRVLMTAEKLGINVDYSHDKVQMYLMNTLMDFTEQNDPEQEDMLKFLANVDNPYVKAELKEGLKVRKKENIMVLFTNPPYNVSTQNSSQWITDKVKEYISEENLTREVGKPQIKSITGLKSSKDDYWKFLRFAQWKIAENDNRHGIVAFITNNFYIDGKVARGLRKEYCKAFDEIWIIDLHGDWKKSIPERAGVTTDINVFDNINCGTAIIFALRYPAKDHKKHKKSDPFKCLVQYSELWGTRESKLTFLHDHYLTDFTFIDAGENLDWEFTPYIQVDADYNSFPYICEIFRINAVGIVSGADNLLSSTNKKRLLEKLSFFFEKKYVDKLYDNEYMNNRQIKIKGKGCAYQDIAFADNRDWRIDVAFERGKYEDAKNSIVEWSWRGFDRRHFAYYPILMKRGTNQFRVMQYLLPSQNNVSLIVDCGNTNDKASHFFISNLLIDHKANGSSTSLGSYSFPLKINLSANSDNFKEPKPAIHSNLSPRFMAVLPYWNWNDLTNNQKMQLSEEVFYYIYGILYSPTYREDYKGLLSKDFPRIPFPADAEIFRDMSQLGRKLASFHLMTDPETIKFSRQITNIATLTDTEYKIGKYKWIPHNDNPMIGDLWFNMKKKTNKGDGKVTTQTDSTALCIYNVPKTVWEFEIGGIQQLNQWLKSRRYNSEPKKVYMTRGITQEELKYFLRMINAIIDTLAIIPQLDDTYTKVLADIVSITIPSESVKGLTDFL